MARPVWPILTRKRPFSIGRSFNRRFGVSRRRRVRGCADRQYRDAVEAALTAKFGVSLPTPLDWLVAAAWRRSIPADDLAAFLAALFELEPLAGR